MNNSREVISLIIFIFTLINLPCHAEVSSEPLPSTPERLVHDLVDFFKEIKAEVVRIEGDLITIDAGIEDGIKRYMRFDLISSRKIKHPVTGEEVGTGDIKTGRIEIVEAEREYSLARLLNGIGEKGSRTILSKGYRRVYIQEEKSVDYFITEDYLRALKTSGFEIVNDKTLSDFTVILSVRASGEAFILAQTCFWSDTGQVFFQSETGISKDYLNRIKKDKALYEEELKGSDLLLSFRLPGSVRFLNIADVDGDGRDDLVIARESSIEVYSLGLTLKGLYEIKLKGEPVGLYSADLNGDGRTEIIVSILQDSRAISEIYELRNGEFKSLYKVSGLVRYVSGNLFYQGYSPYEGPEGEIKKIEPLSFRLEPSELKLQDSDLFGFVFICNSVNSGDCLTLLHDNMGYLTLLNKDGRMLWRSKEDTGGFFLTFKKLNLSPLLKEEEWALKDRLIAEGDKVYLIKRKPVSGVAKGIGWSSSKIVSLKWNGKDMIEEEIKETGGAIIDFYLTTDRLYILQKPFMGISLGSLLKGENPRQTRLYIFKRQ